MTVKNPITRKFLEDVVERFDQDGKIREVDLAWFIRGVELAEMLAESSITYMTSSEKKIQELQEKLLSAEVELFSLKNPSGAESSDEKAANE